MCRGDPTLSTFEWVSSNPPAFTAVAYGQHRCVDWDSLLGWVRDRAIPIFEPGALATPDKIAARKN